MARHCPRLEGSRKLQRLLRYLVLRYPRLSSTMDINIAVPTTRASSDISDLRENGILIVGGDGGHTVSDMSLHYYRLSPHGVAEARRRLAEVTMDKRKPAVRAHDAFDSAAEAHRNAAPGIQLSMPLSTAPMVEQGR